MLKASSALQSLRQRLKPPAAVHNKKWKTTSETSSSSSSAEAPPSASVPIGQSLLAAVAGIVTVSAAAAATEATSSVPPYDPSSQRFDQSHFVGRFSRMILACDPKLLLYTESQVRDYQQLLEKYQQHPEDQARELWEARRIVESAVHPDTGDLIPRPFRMSGYVPYNGPICVAMVASQSTSALLFWSWVNQSQNALVNYFNRNASSPMTNETLATSYAAAVGSALAVAFGLATLIQRRYDPATAKNLLRWVAFPSAVVASSLNCFIVRSPEMQTGVPLLLDDGQTDVLPGATSQVAASRGVYSTTASRALLQAPVYFLPPVLLATGPLKSYLTRHPALAVPITTYLLLVSFGIGLPATVAIFPQISDIPAAAVEEKFQALRNPKDGKPYQTFYYNKGL